MVKSNYETAKKKAQTDFLKYDQQMMIDKFHLRKDDKYLYLRFVGRDYRIDRQTGRAEWTENGFADSSEADFNEAMSIYDVLCYSAGDCRLSGNFCKLGSVKGPVRASAPGNELFAPSARYFDGRTDALIRACRLLGGEKGSVGDVSYRLKIFDFLPMILQFWESDEEFPPSLQFMWDENILDYMHFETTFYVASHVLRRLRELSDL